MDKDDIEIDGSKKEKMSQTKFFDENNNLSNANVALTKYIENADNDNAYFKKLHKKLIKKDIKLNYFKDIQKNKKSTISFENNKNTEFADLLMHLYNQAKIIENLIDNR